ncbi:hypothetical protein [Asaia spathodeae]|uniref:NADH:quinone oxidoreductase/Mrp antiporter membrane subunit domain-containing protein n=1 Tax=Asaia spathodeae TaxID=657016 RepID=A0ABX2P7P9_9PROT|nr:hypothetical protein [Asaia spathodeae]GBR12133.1 hypothetical protein AA105894_0420 [Asaia spathodeae NBRC 105894]
MLRLATSWRGGPLIPLLRATTLGIQGAVGCWGALGSHESRIGPLALDPLSACWIVLWTLSLVTPRRYPGPIGEALGSIGLLCHDAALSLFCFLPCLAEAAHRAKAAQDGQRLRAWRLGLLAPSGCALAILSGFPALACLAPAAGLATLPAFAEMPLLSYVLFVPPLLQTHGFFWPVSLVLLGAGLCLCLHTDKALNYWPLLLLGLTLCAREGGLADTALAGSEAMILALALQGLGNRAFLFQTPLPPLAGFLPFWLGLHVVNGLSGLSPAWTAGAVMLSLLIGVLVVRGWLSSWRSLTRVFTLHHDGLPTALTLGLCLSICPGLLLGLLHVSALDLAGAGQDIWRAWPIWSVAGGDGAFWYPAFVFLIPALIIPAVMTHLPSVANALPDWPSPEIRLRLPWGVRRALALLRARWQTLRNGWRPVTQGVAFDRAPAFRKTGSALARQTLSLWLFLLAAALAWLGWSA